MTDGQIWLGIATIIAVIAGPIFAVQVQKWLERGRAAKSRKLEVFRKLMVTRSVPLNVNHIDALNLIEAEYDSRKPKDRRVLDRWHEYWDHLNTRHGGTAAEDGVWNTARTEKMGALLYAMSEYLGLGIDRSVLLRASYYPQGIGTLDTEIATIRKGLIEMFGKPLKVQIVQEELPGQAENPTTTPPA